MNSPHTRREFLGAVGQGMLVASVGATLASDLGIARVRGNDELPSLDFGSLEPLVRLMQETPIDSLLPTLVDRLNGGNDLRRLVAAGALANARTFGGEDYIGFHTMMALAPAYHMSQELPSDRSPLPVFKVLYRNSNRIGECGGRSNEVLKPVEAAQVSPGEHGGERLRNATRAKDVVEAERTFAALSQGSAEDALNDLLFAVDDATEVHRVVMPYRAYDLLGIIGKERAHTLLRQSVRYCVKNERGSNGAVDEVPRKLLPKMLEEHRLLDRAPGIGWPTTRGSKP